MPTFDTPEPIAAVVDVAGALITVRAADTSETGVDLRPHNPARNADVELAERTAVDLSGGRLTVRSPRTARSRLRNLFAGGERVDVHLTVPVGSNLQVRGWADVTVDGRLGTVEIDVAMGEISLDRVGAVHAKTSMGDIRVGVASGPADLRTATGNIEVGHAAGDLTAHTSAGDVRVERAEAGVRAKTMTGDVRLRSVRSGSVNAETSYGRLEIGVARGTAAWLEVDARHGVVRTELEQADGPRDGERTVEIRATNGCGDIVLRRS